MQEKDKPVYKSQKAGKILPHTYCYKLLAQGGKTIAVDDLIWGSLLADAHCNKRGCITLEGSVIQTPYTFWKWEQCKAGGILTATSTPRLVHRFDKRTMKWRGSLRFKTRTLWRAERKLLYKDDGTGRERKFFPPWDSCRSRWTAGALAVLFMDHGGAGGNNKRGCVFDVSYWDASGRLEMQRTLWECFQLKTSFQGTGNQCKLYILTCSAERFRDLITPYIVPAMWYKCAHLF